MKIFSTDQVREWDKATIRKESTDSINLMERAAQKCTEWLIKNIPADKKFIVFCGKGNNGGDGLAIARMLLQHDRQLRTFILATPNSTSGDFSVNLQRLEKLAGDIERIETEKQFPQIDTGFVVVDALFGYGLNRPLSNLTAALVDHINKYSSVTISIDMPSGLFADKSSKDGVVINATHTLTFQTMKLAFLLPENGSYVGDIHVLDIGLDKDFYINTPCRFEISEPELISSFHRPRKKFSHKGNYGDAALVVGSYGMMGAAVLSARACLKIGAGKLTCYIPACGFSILQTALPEAMCMMDENEKFLTKLSLKRSYEVYGIGPGMGQQEISAGVLEELFLSAKGPVVVDADALNILSTRKDLYEFIPANSILTPHPKEFERLFGGSSNDFERLELALEKARALKIFIVLKGHYSFIAMPEGRGFFNPTGNPGMATAGSGDVLTGVLTGLLAQGYGPIQAALAGVYLHGLAGDIAAEEWTQEAMMAGDICNAIPVAIKKIFYR